jgi:hypothetical protein
LRHDQRWLAPGSKIRDAALVSWQPEGTGPAVAEAGIVSAWREWLEISTKMARIYSQLRSQH